jgi:hypothetical protein
MIWFASSRPSARDLKSGLDLALRTSIPLLREFIARRECQEDAGLAALAENPRPPG